MSEPNQQPTPPTEPRLPWRKLIDRNSEDFTFDDLPDDPRDPGKKLNLTVRVERVEQFGKVKSVQGGQTKSVRCPKLYFVGIPKPLAVKATNAKLITTVTGSKYPVDWKDALITLCPEYDAPAFGSTADVVRVLPVKPTMQQWERCQKGYRPPPFSLEMALASITSARSTDELRTWKANLAIPKGTDMDAVEKLRAAYKQAEAALVEAEQGEEPYDPDEHAEKVTL